MRNESLMFIYQRLMHKLVNITQLPCCYSNNNKYIQMLILKFILRLHKISKKYSSNLEDFNKSLFKIFIYG